MVTTFAKVRDDWIAADLAGWLAPNAIYDGVATAVAAAVQHDETYIVTTKQVRGRRGQAWPACGRAQHRARACRGRLAPAV
jgi:hypothetical protein